MKFINIPVFILSFAVGLFFVYLSSPNNKTVVVFPTPDNQEKIQYIDSIETCHKYVANETQCPSNKDDVIDYTVQ